MTVQELIEHLMNVEDKSIQVINYHDGYYHIVDDIVITQLYADTENKDITNWDEDLKKLKSFLLINL